MTDEILSIGTGAQKAKNPVINIKIIVYNILSNYSGEIQLNQ